MVIFGTRPEAIKVAPVIQALRREPWANVLTVATAQHRHLLDQVTDFFGIVPDVDLDLMLPSQSLSKLTGRLMMALEDVLSQRRPDVVLGQGDTTTVLSASLAAFYRGIPFGHIEAGLRTTDLRSPFPEEANRRITGQLSSWHFAPTETAKANLLGSGVPANTILVTGNTVIDALKIAVGLDPQLGLPIATDRLVLVTVHRRENLGAPLSQICSAVRRLAHLHKDVTFVWPVHPNPDVTAVVHASMVGAPNVLLTAPLQYGPFVAAMRRATLILTDSGGVQEEAPALGTPVLVLRTETERPEAIEHRAAKLVGTDEERIVYETSRLLDDFKYLESEFNRGVSPYGDGLASERIVAFLRGQMIG